MQIEALLSELKNDRLRLEGELAGRRSQMDRIIARIEQELLPVAVAPPESSGTASGTSGTDAGATAPTVRRNGRTSPVAGSPTPRPPKRSRTDSASAKIRSWVEEHHGQFTALQIRNSIKASNSAVSCALVKLLKTGVIQRLGYATYVRTGKSTQEKYAEFRAGLGELKSPEIQTPTLRGDA